MTVVRDTPARPSEPDADVAADVREIVDAVRRGDGLAVIERLDGIALDSPAELRVGAGELEAALDGLDADVRAGLELAAENVGALVQAQLREPVEATLAQGQQIRVDELPLARAGVYAPGGRAAYPSTVVMCAVTARAAGVGQIVVCTPPGPGGRAHEVVLAACALCGVDEVYRVGGAQAVAAMAYGLGPLEPVDVIAGPGNAYVTEAKRQVSGDVGIDGLAGPSELVVVASEGADADLVALDLLAQAEHGPDGLLAVTAPDAGFLDAVTAAFERGGTDATLYTVEMPPAEGLALSERLAPEHLELVGAEAEALAGEVRRAGCLFVGNQAATAFGDYVAGSNHVLPTGGAARFQSALSASTFRRRMARVTFPGDSAAKLAPAGAAIARAEGFPVHAESMERRA
ncbi:MAG TPA: histidinol dehydrogenase [Thermoleophilaceae bacterium]|nr:histidinol dehydrogenase [Thermoleophilaceae bacterium]